MVLRSGLLSSLSDLGQVAYPLQASMSSAKKQEIVVILRPGPLCFLSGDRIEGKEFLSVGQVGRCHFLRSRL